MISSSGDWWRVDLRYSVTDELYTLAVGLGIAEQTEEFVQSGVTPRAGEAWAGKLEEWLETILPRNAVERDEDPDESAVGPASNESYAEWTDRHRAGVQSWSFPTEELLLEYLRSVATRQESDVMALLRLLLFEESCFGQDSEHLHQALNVRRDLSYLDAYPTEYRRRLLRWLGGAGKPHPSIRWH